MLSTYCGQRGIPPCHRCKDERCACECHAAIPAQNKANQRGSIAALRENRDEPDRSVCALQPGSDRTFLTQPERGLV